MCNIRRLNILLLGETGVGKSTWINGLINFMTFPSLQEAVKGKPISRIPSKFTITDENFEERPVVYGSDQNESYVAGQSATQMPKSYILDFASSNMELCIIDTPGIGDTRGIDQDRVNMRNILLHLANYEELHGIIILLKPNNARLTVMFQFCIKELLANLHRDACKNMVICFTNARSTSYRPADTMQALKALLKDVGDIPLELSKDTVYCMDNEPVRFLMAMKENVPFSDEDKVDYERSWNKSTVEVKRLLEYVTRLEPHPTRYTISLNDVRSSILALNRPLAEISSVIANNKRLIEEKQKTRLDSSMDKSELIKKLYVPVIDLEVIPLSLPRTVCTSPKCVQLVTIGDVTQTVYKTVCCKPCLLSIDKNQIGCSSLNYCKAMRESKGKTCSHCGCPRKTHMHITYKTKLHRRKVKCTDVSELLNQQDSKQKAIDKGICDLEKKLDELRVEETQLLQTCAKFAHFLKNNSITPYNDAVLDYIEHLRNASAGNPATLDSFQQLKLRYEQQNQIIEEAISKESEKFVTLTLEDIRTLIVRLKELPIAGPMLQDVMDNAEEADNIANQLSEHIVQMNGPWINMYGVK